MAIFIEFPTGKRIIDNGKCDNCKWKMGNRGGIKMDLDKEELKATKNMQSTAENAEKTSDEIFEELGYEIEKIGNGTEYYLDDREEKEIDILVNVDSKKPEIWLYDCDVLSMQELKAIYKKCKEEGWI